MPDKDKPGQFTTLFREQKSNLFILVGDNSLDQEPGND
jgi:hypothetical protein